MGKSPEQEARRTGKIDVHHHIFAPFFMDAKLAHNRDIGWTTPPENLPWSLSKSLAMMDRLGIAGSVLSYPAGVPEKMGGEFDNEADEIARKRGRDEVRKMNLYAKQLCDSKESQGRFGWFAALPDMRDVEGALLEIQYALDVLRADGISLSSSYGEGGEGVYLGDARFDVVWRELDRRETVVFVHGTQTNSSKPYPHAWLGLPITEVPNETFKAAAHLVVTGTKRRYPRVRIILAHFGGTAMALMPRVSVLAGQMGCPLTAPEVIEDFASFYVESALSAHESTVRLVEDVVGRKRMLFGTDYPAVGLDAVQWYTENLERCYARDAEGLATVTRQSALDLFPRFLNI
ncbi:amidohydrolase 2 [Trametopsis cervina]|nr:amidohydrolase 2 [Trametopsis cervina]